MLYLLKASVKFHTLYTKSSIQEKLGRHEDAERTMDSARQAVKDATEEFKSRNTTR
jgi:hypothetical protein